MKKNKKRLVISILVLFVICISVIVYIIFNKNVNTNEDKGLGIERIITLNNINVKVGENFYVKDEGEKLVIYDFNNNIISEYPDSYSYYEIINEKYILVTNKIIKRIIDKNGNELAIGTHVKSSYDNKYILVDNCVYDNDMNKVYLLDFTGEFEYTAEFGNDLLFINSYQKDSKSVIVDLKEKKVLWDNFENSASYSNNGNVNYFRFTKDNKGYLFDAKRKQILYEDITYENESYMDYNTFMYKDNVLYIEDDIIYKDNTKINNRYIMSKDTCDKGYKLKDNKNNIVVDKCMYAYKMLFDDAILGIDEENYILFYKDKEIVGGEITLEGDYIKVAASLDLLGDGSTYEYYNKNLKQIDISEDISISYIADNVYSGYDYVNYNSSFLDKDLKIIEDNLYNIYCDNNYCDISKNVNEHYLYKDGKKLVDDAFVNINFNKDEIILESLYKTYIVKLGNNKKRLDFNFDFNIDIDEIISKYNLKDIEFKINKNEKLFNKYAYIIENNKMLLNYKKEVYDLFEIIVDKKDFLDEFYFLHKLGYLNIHKADILHNGKADGTYQDFNTRIDFVTDENRVIYHELVHFVDYSISNSVSTILYKCNNKIDVYEAIPNIPDGCDYVNMPYTNYIVESGAEAFTSKYFTKNVTAYNFGTYYLEALEYIYKTKNVDEWYFKDDNYFIKTLYEEFNDEKIVSKVIEALNDTTSLDATYKSTGYLMDILIDLYKKHNGEDYLNDKKFTFLIRPMLDYVNVDKSKYYNEFKNLFNIDYGDVENIKEEINYENFNSYLVPIIIDDKMYLSWNVWNNNTKNAIVWINYDFLNDKVNNYVVVE